MKKLKLKSIGRFLQKKSCILYLAIAVAIVFFSSFYIYPFMQGGQQNNKQNYKGVLQIWNIDTFEGGKGSRTSFLQLVAKSLEKRKQGLFVLVTTHTISSAKDALQKGERPDLISYGTGCDFVADIAQPIETKSFRAATLHGKCYAYPWAVGEYILISFEDNFEDIQPQNTVLAENVGGLTTVAAAATGLFGQFAVQESTTAYSNFVSKKFKYLLGTQRDVSRLLSRNLSFYTKAINSFSNLQQYISITTADRARLDICKAYVELLLSQEVQQKLTQIGMMSLQYKIYTPEHPLYAIEQVRPQHTISPFLEGKQLQTLYTLAREVLQVDKNQAQNLQKFYILYL